MNGRPAETFDIGPVESLPLDAMIRLLFNFAIKNNYAAALWKLPSEGKIRMIVDVSGARGKLKIDLDEAEQGFVFSPFNNLDNSHSFFIKNDIELSGENELIFSQNLSYNKTKEIRESLNQALTEVQTAVPAYYTSSIKPADASEDEFKASVRTALDNFTEDKFQKVVLSRVKTVRFSDDFDPLNGFSALCEQYPNAFTSFTVIPRIGAWLGASPEILISVDRKKVFRTAAIAGTQLYSAGIDLVDVAWTQKEIEEQAMVSRYIVNCFKKIRLREFEEIGPRTVRAGNLVHLKTDFVVDTIATGFPQLGAIMLELLHPTSAVCGVPRQTALDFIQRFEHYDRSFYSGYLGPMNMYGETHLFVNIRCMQLFEKEAALYAGAGITHGSKPEKEWLETEIKMKTMLGILNNHD